MSSNDNRTTGVKLLLLSRNTLHFYYFLGLTRKVSKYFLDPVRQEFLSVYFNYT